jgi:hypothetical protein
MASGTASSSQNLGHPRRYNNTEYGVVASHMWSEARTNLPHMAVLDLKKVLWENVSALMEEHWKGENLSRLAREAKLGPGTAQRIKDQETSVGIDIVAKVAGVFRVSPCQLLVPKADRHVSRILDVWHHTDDRGRLALELACEAAEQRIRAKSLGNTTSPPDQE